MEKTLPLYLGPSVIGSVVIYETEKGVRLVATTYASVRGICRAYVRGSDGELLVGVLVPDGHRFSAEKNASATLLLASGLSFDSITYAFVVCSEEKSNDFRGVWQKLGSLPEILCRDKAINALARASGALCDNAEAPTRLAVPLFTGLPFPRPDVLCLLTPQKIGETVYGVIGISKSGTPESI